MLIQLIENEILSNKDWKIYNTFVLECSPVFNEFLQKSLKEKMLLGKAILSGEQYRGNDFTISTYFFADKIQINICPVLEQGYTIKPVDNDRTTEKG